MLVILSLATKRAQFRLGGAIPRETREFVERK